MSTRIPPSARTAPEPEPDARAAALHETPVHGASAGSSRRPDAAATEPRAQDVLLPATRSAARRCKQPHPPKRGHGLAAARDMTACERRALIGRSQLYRELEPQVRRSLDRVLLRLEEQGGAPEMLHLQRIMASPFWQQASREEQLAVLTVLTHVPLWDVDQHTPAQGRGVSNPSLAMAELAERRDSNGRPLLLSLCHGGQSLAFHLGQMSESFISLPASNVVILQAGLSGAEILGGAILEINDSGRIAQGNVGTCTVTALQIALIDQRPAEYARLVTGLVADGRVALANGNILNREESSIRPTPGNSRTPTERLFQASLMDYGNILKKYSVEIAQEINRVPWIETMPIWQVLLQAILLFPSILLAMVVRVNVHGEVGRESFRGLSDVSLRRVATSIFGEPWHIRPGDSGGHQELMERQADGDFASDRVQVNLRWATAKSSDDNVVHANHALRLLRIDPEHAEPRMVIMHNPWGSRPEAEVGAPVGRGAPADLVWVDPERGIVGLPLAQFEERLLTWIAPAPAQEAETAVAADPDTAPG